MATGIRGMIGVSGHNVRSNVEQAVRRGLGAALALSLPHYMVVNHVQDQVLRPIAETVIHHLVQVCCMSQILHP